MFNKSRAVNAVGRIMYGGLAVAILLFGLTSAVYAQQATGAIRGAVAGAGEGVVVEAVVVNIFVSRWRTPVADGSFRFDAIPIGSY